MDDEDHNPESTPDSSETPLPADPGYQMPLSAFAKLVRPKLIDVPDMGKPGRTKKQMLPGKPEEIWLKLLKIRHGAAKLTETQWHAAIKALAAEPAWKQ